MKNGFNISAEGRAGKGVYFWQYYGSSVIAKELAVGWYLGQAKRNAYKEENSECAVIDATFDVEDDDILDCTGEILEEATLLLRKLAPYSEDDIHGTYEALIGRVEALRGKPFLATKAIVSPPKMSFPSKQTMPYPPILVVRSQEVKIAAQLMEV